MATAARDRGEMLRQVMLERERDGGGFKRDVFWIRNELATVGRRVVDEAGFVWTVVEAYNARRFADVEAQIKTWSEFAKTLEGH